MGGFGSGRDKYATRPTADECLTIDVNEFTDVLEAGEGGVFQWASDDQDAQRVLWHVIDGPDRLHLQLAFAVTMPNSEGPRLPSYRVPITTTSCNFGGERPWFICPGAVDGGRCERRVGKLYCPPKGTLFLCRHCHDLGYASSRASGNDLETARLRFERTMQKLDAEPRHPNRFWSVPPRPDGMHRTTYEQLIDELTAARREWQEALKEKLDQVDGTLERKWEQIDEFEATL